MYRAGKRRLAAAVAAAGACMLLAACSPVKMGAAAIVGNQRITSTSLNSDVSNLQRDIAQYDPGVQVNTAILPKLMLGNLISWEIRDRTAQDLGVTVSPSDIDQAISYVYQSAQQSAQQSGGSSYNSPDQMVVSQAVPVNLADNFGRYYAVELNFLKSKNGGKLPTTNSAAVQQAVSQFSMAECRASKELNVQVNPMYGQLSFDQQTGLFTVTAGSDTLSAAGGTKPVTATPYTPAC